MLEPHASRYAILSSAIHLLSRLLRRSTKDLIYPSRAAITDMARQRLLYHALFYPVPSRFLAFYITTRSVLGRLTCSPLAFTASSTLRTTITGFLLTCNVALRYPSAWTCDLCSQTSILRTSSRRRSVATENFAALRKPSSQAFGDLNLGVGRPCSDHANPRCERAQHHHRSAWYITHTLTNKACS